MKNTSVRVVNQDENHIPVIVNSKIISKRSKLNLRLGGPLSNITNISVKDDFTKKLAGKTNAALNSRVRTFPQGQNTIVSQPGPQEPEVSCNVGVVAGVEEVRPGEGSLDPMVVDEKNEKIEWYDIDENDADDTQQATDLVNHIYDFLSEKEQKVMIDPSYLSQQVDLNERMRSILVDWMVAVHLKFRLLPESLFLSVNIVDRYLEKNQVPRNKLQLVSVAAMLIAAKYEEIYPPECNDYVYISDKSYTRQQILDMEIEMLNALDFNLTIPTSLHFLRRFSKAAKSDWKAHTLSKYLIEIPLLDVKMLKHVPSKIAAAAVYLTRQMLHLTPLWTPNLEHYSKYNEATVKIVAVELNDILKKVNTSTLKTIRKKYASEKFGKISTIETVDF